MSFEIVDTETEVDRQHLDSLEGGRGPMDRKTTIFKSKNKVAFVKSTLIAGVPVKNKYDATGNYLGKEKSNKRYWSWHSFNSFGFFRNRYGNIQPYQCVRPWDSRPVDKWTHHKANKPWLELDEDTEAGTQFSRAVKDIFKISSIYDVYPMAERFGLYRYDTLPNELRPGMRHNDLRAFVATTFGSKRTNDALINAAAATDPYITALAHQMRGLVDDDKLVKFMEFNHFDEEMEEGFTPHSPFIRPLFKALTEAERNLLLKDTLDLTALQHIHSVSASIYRSQLEAIRFKRTRGPVRRVTVDVNSWKTFNQSIMLW